PAPTAPPCRPSTTIPTLRRGRCCASSTARCASCATARRSSSCWPTRWSTTSAPGHAPFVVQPLDPRAYERLAAVGLSPDPFNPAQHRSCELVERYALD